MTAPLRTLCPADLDRWYEALERAFGGVPAPAGRRALRTSLTEPERAIGAWDGDECVGTAVACGFEMSAPGGALVPTAGVTMVGVVPTHRRRGVLTAMMRRQLDDVRERGEPLAILTASEPAVYGRYGYGVASRRLMMEIDAARARGGALGPPRGPDGPDDGVRLRAADPEKALAACEAVYARQVRERPGMLVRDGGWERWPLLDPPSERAGGSPLQCVLAERDGAAVGFARFRVRISWSHAGPTGTVDLKDLHALDLPAYTALWRFLLGIDLTTTVRAFDRPVDDPLLHLVPDARRLEPRLRDAIHLRLVDVGAALSARAYRAPVDVVLDVEDAFCPWNTGRRRLSGDSDGALCERTTDPADLALSVRDLGAAYLGGVTLAELAAAGLVRELSPGALARASLAFGSDVAPWLPYAF